MAQLKSTNILGNLAVTGEVVASSIKIPGGLASQVLMANGETKTLGTAAYKSEESFLAANALNGYLSTSNTPVDNEIVRFDGTTGKVQTSGATINDSGDITAKRYLVGTWLQTTANNALGSAATKICVQDDNGWLYTRTPTQICSDIKALPLTGGTITGNTTFEGNIYLGGDSSIDVEMLGDVYIYGTLDIQEGGVYISQLADLRFEGSRSSIRMEYDSTFDALTFKF